MKKTLFKLLFLAVIPVTFFLVKGSTSASSVYYCDYYSNIKIVEEALEEEEVIIEYEEGVFSWYGEFFHGRKMANGKIFDMYNENVIAHKTLAFGTTVEVFNPHNNTVLLAVVEDRGPYIAGRDFDLSYAGAKKLDIVNEGVAKLQFRVIE